MKFLIIRKPFENMRDYSTVDKYLGIEPDPAFARRAGIIFNNLKGLKKGVKVLDCGCGRGFYLKVVSVAFPDLKLYGTDLNNNYLTTAQKTIANKDVKLSVGNAEDLSFNENYFDAVIASEILEHVENDGKVLEEIKRILKPNGIAMITVPNKNYPILWDPLNWILERFFNTHIPSNIWWLAGIWADHKRLYSKEELVQKVHKVGLRVDKIWETTHYCFPFSHFIFYGIGKNLVEIGFFQDFNRFSKGGKLSLLNQLVLFPVRLLDKLNNGLKKFDSNVNIVLKVIKS
jgi:2-polyprenyl-6-hydroxyphenyl methylase / 3-demethylubiquinone-9 3-methyltransferase